MRVASIAVACLLVNTAWAQGASVPQPSRAEAETHLVVFNRPGPNFEKAKVMRDAALAHQKLYRGLADEGKIIAGGRLTGEPVLGLSIFAKDVDKAKIRSLLENDPGVKAGLVAIEFREWQLQMGGVARPPEKTL